MPYTKENPPEAIKGLPAHAQEIFIAAYNAASKEYKGDEAKSNATAWAAVKTKYEKKDKEWVVRESIKEADMSLDDKRRAVQSALEQKFKPAITPNTMAWVDDIWDDKAVYQANGETFECPYTIDEKGLVVFGTPTKVVRKTVYQAVESDGQRYPAKAYAYIPDTAKPETWKLRLWEGNQLSKVQLGYAAASLSPGGLAGKRIDIKESDLPEVKRNIRAGFRTLGVPDEDIPKWVKESESRTLLTGYIPLTEAKVDKGTAKITIIQAGFNSSKDRYYPPETLARDYKVFEGLPMYADHPSESDEKNRPERSIRDKVGKIQNVSFENNKIIGEAVVYDSWMQERLATLRDKGMLNEIGTSINAVGSATQAEIEGTKTNYIEKIARGRSVDFVTEAGAGGLVEMYEAERDVDVDFITLTTLRERRPDLVKEIETVVKNTITKEAKKQMELETEIKDLQESNATLTKERDDLKAEKESAVKAKLVAETKAVIEEAVGKAELPEATKTRILERFKDAEKSDGLAEAIKAETDYIAAITESGKVKGLGGGNPDTKANKDALKESWKRLHPEWSEAQLETAIKGR
jgi:cation transport regulator ChaB